MASIELEGVWWGHEDIDKRWIYKKRQDIVNFLGVDVSFYNASQKELKYVTFTFVPYNDVNDKVLDDFRKGAIDAKVTGPIAPDSIANVRFNNLWVSPVITRVEVEKISVEFMDGTTENIASQDIVYIKNKKGCSEDNNTWSYWREPVGKVDVYKLAKGFRWYSDYNRSSAFYINHANAVSEIQDKSRKSPEELEAERVASEKRRAEAKKAEKKAQARTKIIFGIVVGAIIAIAIFSFLGGLFG